MKNWKMQENVKRAYDDLYSAVDPDDANSDIYISLIIKNVFVSNEEQTDKNAIWTQAILEIIHETEIKPPGSKWSGPGPPEGRNRVEIGSK